MEIGGAWNEGFVASLLGTGACHKVEQESRVNAASLSTGRCRVGVLHVSREEFAVAK